MSYVVTRKHVYEVANEVFFAYSLDEAMARKIEREAMQDEDGGTHEWLVAAVLA